MFTMNFVPSGIRSTATCAEYHSEIIKIILISCTMEYHGRLVGYTIALSGYKMNDYNQLILDHHLSPVLYRLSSTLMAMLFNYYVQFAPGTFIDVNCIKITAV